MLNFEELGLEFRSSRRHGGEWLWPKEDIWAWKWLNKLGHWDLPRQISELCIKRDLVIQAGGNAGLYPKQYSKLFNQVVTCEPNEKNFLCLSHNVPDDNVTKYQCALGDKPSNIRLERQLIGEKDVGKMSRPGVVGCLLTWKLALLCCAIVLTTLTKKLLVHISK